jgi:predicted DNA binding CopG/RHH family protein
MTSEALKKAQKNYRKKMNRITLGFSPAEQEMWEHLQNQPKKQTYIKNLIKKDMSKGET